jgi:phage-related protein (TIGR01555 family)
MGRPPGSLNKSTLEKQSRTDDLQAIVDGSVQNPLKLDGWNNILAGLGGVMDKSQHTVKGDFAIIDDDTLASIYMSEGLGRRIVDIVADDETREWISLGSNGDKKNVTVITDELTRLSAESNYNEALKWQRLFGGSLIFVGAMDGRVPSEPLRENQIKNIEFLKVIDRTDVDISGSKYDVNPNSPMFGKIIQYKVHMHVGSSYIEMLLHHTRVIPFFGDPIPTPSRLGVEECVKYFGMSCLQSVYEDIRDLGGVTQTTVNILYEFIISRIRIKDLKKILSMEGGEAAIGKRLQVMNTTKSVINAMVMDSEDDMGRDYSTVAGLPELIDRFMLKVAGTSRIPVTRLFGRSPAGLNATGESDLTNYYDMVEASQRNRFMPVVRRTVNLICAWKGIKKAPKITFNSLYQMSEEEKAKVDYTEAQTKQIYVNMGALDADEVRHDTLGLTGVVEMPEPTAEELATLNPTKPGDPSKPATPAKAPPK